MTSVDLMKEDNDTDCLMSTMSTVAHRDAKMNYASAWTSQNT